jgi:DNA-binding transcriptional ArsR family regulator
VSLPERQFDLRGLKALAHPLRQRILYHLAFVGSANSTEVAKAFSESTGVTSYHLRQLAAAGVIEEETSRRRGRERWWRIVPLDLRGLTAEASTEPRADAVTADLQWIRFDRDQKLITRHLAQASVDPAIEKASVFSSSAAHLTPDELVSFTEEFVTLLKRYWRNPEDRPAEASPVAVMLYAFPWPGEPR